MKGAVAHVRMSHIASPDLVPSRVQGVAESGDIFLYTSSDDWDMVRFVTGVDIGSVYVTSNAFEEVEMMRLEMMMVTRPRARLKKKVRAGHEEGLDL